MTTDKEKSFVATLTTSSGPMLVPRLTYGRPTRIRKLDFDAFSLEPNKDISNYLCVKANTTVQPLYLYFRYSEDFYSIYVINVGAYYNYALSNEDEDFIALYPPAHNQTTFNLLSADSKVITLDDLEGDFARVQIQTRAGNNLRARAGNHASKADKEKVTGLVCTGAKGGKTLTFGLTIVQRNVGY